MQNSDFCPKRYRLAGDAGLSEPLGLPLGADLLAFTEAMSRRATRADSVGVIPGG